MIMIGKLSIAFRKIEIFCHYVDAFQLKNIDV